MLWIDLWTFDLSSHFYLKISELPVANKCELMHTNGRINYRGGFNYMNILFNDTLMRRSDCQVDIEDRGYQFGDGIYEVIRIYNGIPFTMAEHLKRLERSLNEISIKLPYPLSHIEKNIELLLKEDEIQDGIVYIQITRGSSARVHHFPSDVKPVVVAYTKTLARPKSQLEQGIKVITTEDIRWLRCDIKSLNLLGNVLAKQKAVEAGAIEAILHRGETVTEGSSTNVMIVKDGAIYTHPVTNLILNGITREVVLQSAKELGIELKQETFTVGELLTADEVFMTSTTSEVTPIIQVNEAMIGEGVPGPITKKLQQSFVNKIMAVPVY